jgi:hypothetical protein
VILKKFKIILMMVGFVIILVGCRENDILDLSDEINQAMLVQSGEKTSQSDRDNADKDIDKDVDKDIDIDIDVIEGLNENQSEEMVISESESDIIPSNNSTADIAQPDSQGTTGITTGEQQNEDESDIVSDGTLDNLTNNTNILIEDDNSALENKMASISFNLISNYYVRESMEDGIPYIEIFELDRNDFTRIVLGDIEKEAFSYNYVTDEFTYLYYFSQELISKVVFVVSTNQIIEDADGLAQHLVIDAELLKTYFSTLIQRAGIDINQL